MGASVTDDESRHTESSKDYVFENLDYYSCVICWRGYSLDPFGYVIDNYEYVFVTEGRWEGSHEVNSPNIEDFYF